MHSVDRASICIGRSEISNSYSPQAKGRKGERGRTLQEGEFLPFAHRAASITLVIQKMKTRKRFRVPEGHHPRGTTLREALQGNLPLRGFAFAGVSSRVLRGLCGAMRDLPRVVTYPCDPRKLVESVSVGLSN